MEVSPLRALTQFRCFYFDCKIYSSRNGSKPVEGIDTLDILHKYSLHLVVEMEVSPLRALTRVCFRHR